MCYVLGARNNFCEITRFAIFDNTTKPNHCPIKPVPEKYDLSIYRAEELDGEYEYGWNACINEIIGK